MTWTICATKRSDFEWHGSDRSHEFNIRIAFIDFWSTNKWSATTRLNSIYNIQTDTQNRVPNKDKEIKVTTDTTVTTKNKKAKPKWTINHTEGKDTGSYNRTADAIKSTTTFVKVQGGGSDRWRWINKCMGHVHRATDAGGQIDPADIEFILGMCLDF